MGILLVFLCTTLVVCLFMAYLCSMGGKSKLYCRLYDNEEWRGWEAVIENFDTIEFDNHHVYEDKPFINCYAFKLNINDETCVLNYWEKADIISVHNYSGVYGCLCGFDQYHQKIVKEMLSNKFDFMRDVIMVR